MAADSDGTLTAVVICEGNLHDPEFPKKFRFLLGKLKAILQQPKSKKLKVNKVEPWNSVRVTLSIPKDAAARLRQLASEGSNALRALGILSVQLEGDSVISLRLAGQEIVLRTDNNPAGCAQEAGSSSGLSDLSRMLAANPMQTAGPSCSTLATPNNPPLLSEPIPGPSRVIPQSPAAASSIVNLPLISGPNYDKPPIFKSPNTICPMDGKLPAPPITNIIESREYPFESMTQARVIQRRENTMAVAAALGVNQTQLPSQSTSVPSSPQPIVVAGPSQGMVIGQIPQLKQVPQPPPPLAIPTKPLVVSQQQQQQSLAQDQAVKSQFVQPPPPPYPTAVNSLKSSLSLHQANTITLPGNPSLSSNSNNIAISSPLLVNLLQNDGVNQVKPHQQTVGVQKPSVVIPQHQSMPSPMHQTIISNIKSPQQNDIMLNSPGVVNHLTSGDSNVMMQSGQIIVNNNGVMNPSSVSTNISLNPSMPVPSSLTISNISTLNANQPSPHNATSPASAIGQSPQAIVNSNLIGQIPPNINIRMQQHQSRFPLTSQQQHILLRQQQIIPPGGGVGPLQRFPQQNQSPQQQILSPPSQQQFRHPPVQQQTSPQRQQYVTPPPSPHPNAIVMNQNISLQSTSVVLNHQQQQQQQQQPPQMQQQISQQMQHQQMLGTSYNHPRWPFKPMDSATKSSFQEFTRYQMQYNLQQQLNQTSGTTVAGTSSPDKSCLDPIGLGLSDLDELTKNDLESLLPNLNANDLDTALGLDGKNALESLLDEKDLDLDLIGQDISSFSDENLLEVALGPAIQDNNGNEASNVFQGIDSALTSSGKQRQYLINPLTGELEPMPSEESDNEPENIEAFNEFNSEISNSLFSDDENSCSTAFSKASDHSDTERSTNSEASSRSRYSKNKKDRKDLIGGAATSGSSGSSNKKAKLGLKGTLLREKLQQGIREKLSGKTKAPREKSTKVKLVATPLSENKDSPAEKIKLRLKLEKSEPVTPAYKVDISFVQSPKRAQTAVSTSTSVATALTSFSSTSLAMTPSSSPIAAQLGNSLHTSTSHQQQQQQQQQSPAGEELRVPPLHISLRGKNSIIIKNSKKDRKKSQSGGEEDEYFKKSQLKRNHNSYEDAATISRIIQSTTEEMVKNNHVNRVISQGKPTTRQSSEDFLLGQINSSKLMSPPNQIIENGGDMVDNFGDKTNQTSKRNATDFVQCPNGLICPDTKRRRMSQTVLEHQLQLQHNQHQQQQLQQQQQQQQQQIQQDNLLDLIGPYSHLKGPIGSTNVGTLPQHLNLSKNQKGSNNNISQPFNIKSGKNVVKSGKPLAVVKSSKSPTSNPVKDPGKSPPVMLQVTTSTTTPAVTTTSLSLQSTISSLTSSSAADIKQSIMKGSSSKATSCLLPQGTTDSVSQEKFKQKLLEFQNSEKITTDSGVTAAVVVNNTANTQTVDLQSAGHNNQCSSSNKSQQNDIISPSIPDTMTPPSSTLSTTTKSTNSVEDLGDNNNKIDKFRESECAKSHNNNRSPDDVTSGQMIANQQTQQQQQQQQQQHQHQQQQQQPQDTPPNASPSTTRISTSDNNNTGTPGSISSTLTSNSSNPNVRSSPGSQAQGEDSGIESMDALSEKSPHQSASPQQGDQGVQQKQPGTVHIIKHDSEEKPTLIETKDDIMVEEITNISDIEAALAKMEGINEHFLTPCESPSQKFNGDLTMKDDCLLQNLTDDKVSVQVFCAPKIEQDLTDIILGTDDDNNKPTKLECRDLNENKEISSKISLETQLIDECCKKSLKPNIKLENDDIVVRTLQNSDDNKKLDKCVIDTAEIVDVKSEDIKQEQPQIKEEPHDVTLSEEQPAPTSAAAAGTATKDGLILKEVLAPISIDIPTQSETDAHRIRTRASSKLESPLDFSKQSPQLDSPANSLKSNLRLSSSGGTIERLSPKVNAGKGLTGTGKRKRQGSESSTQSCVSDDTPNKGASGGGANSNSKRCRQNNNINNGGGNGESVNNNTTKLTSNNTKRGASSESCISGKGNQTKTKKNDESSDSDEPLIEVVGKVRNTKVTGKANNTDAEKVLRNHRGAQMKSTTSNAVTNTSNNISSNAAKTSRGSSAAAAATTLSASALSTQAGGGNVPLSSTNTQTTNSSHATRGTNQVIINLMDDKIGTRRSVRASAAANKIIYSKNTLSETPKNSVNKLNSPTIAEATDARRKTRSAAGTCNETLTEGRRRRGSRDSK